jgi:hypothetical protein
MTDRYRAVSGVIFGIIATIQATRALAQLPFVVGSFELPIWASWLAATITGGLCIWAYQPPKPPQP